MSLASTSAPASAPALLRATAYTDWYAWGCPPEAWCIQHATVPGLRWTSDGTRISNVLLHRSHFGLVPPMFRTALEQTATFTSRGAQRSPVALRPYQQEALPFLLSRRGLLLAMQMRLGKTPLTTHAHDPRDGTLLVIGPLASRDVWVEWIERVHGFRPLVLHGTQDIGTTPIPKGYPAYFVHFDVLDPWVEFFASQRIATLVLDEIHVLQNRKSKRYSATSAITARTDRIIGLTGTPMWSKPFSMYPLLHIVSPGAWGDAHTFGRRYCGAMPSAYGWTYNGLSHQEEFAERLNRVMLRKTWQDVAPELPPTTTTVEPVRVSGATLATIEKAAINAALARSASGFTATTAGYLATLRRKLAAVKIGPAIDSAETAMNSGHSHVVVWAWHKDVAEKLAEEARKRKLQTFRYRSGDDTDQIRAFRAASTGVMVASIAAGGVAIDLSVSDYAIFAELDWIPANVNQAAMRTFNPARPHVLVYLYADVPVEMRLIEVLGVKEDFQNSLGLGFDAVASRILE
jgi:SWI/SNF-related matrix-associated actin-dependent regulator 1 of chromatin subfamily A